MNHTFTERRLFRCALLFVGYCGPFVLLLPLSSRKTQDHWDSWILSKMANGMLFVIPVGLQRMNACGYQEKSMDNQSSHCERCSAMSWFEQQYDRNIHGHGGTDPLTFDLIS